MTDRPENVGQRVQKVDRKADDITPGFYLDILDHGTLKCRDLLEARNTLWDAIRAVGFLDRYHDETGDEKDRQLAEASATNAREDLPEEYSREFEDAWWRRKKYHQQENRLTERLESGDSVSQREALDLFREKSGDAFLYAPVIESAVGKDFSDPLYTHLQLWDVVDEYGDREEDVENNRPNAFEHVSKDILRERADTVASSVANFDFGQYGFVQEEIESQHESALYLLP